MHFSNLIGSGYPLHQTNPQNFGGGPARDYAWLKTSHCNPVRLPSQVPEQADMARLVQRKYAHLLFKYLKCKYRSGDVARQRYSQGLCAVDLAAKAEKFKGRAGQVVEEEMQGEGY